MMVLPASGTDSTSTSARSSSSSASRSIRVWRAPGDGPVQNRHIEVLLLGLDPARAGPGGGLDRDDAAVLRHIGGELPGTDGVGHAHDILLVGGDQGPQHQAIGDPIDHRQVAQGLAADLGHTLTGDQRIDFQLLRQRDQPPAASCA